MLIGKLYRKWLIRRGKAVDICSFGGYPSQVLSNLCGHKFYFCGVYCQSMEGFLQSLKYQDPERQRQICAMKGRRAKNMSNTCWQTDQMIWWRGTEIDRHSDEYQTLIRNAYTALFEQDERFRAALMATRGMRLYHSRGERNPYKTILTEAEFCSVLTELRDSYDGRERVTEARRRRLYFELDGVLMDSDAGAGREMPGARDAVRILSEHYDCYILSAAPWEDPSAWGDKVLWVTKHMDEVFHKRIVLTHCRYLCSGDILIDGKSGNYTGEFEGELIEFGSERFPDWDSVLRHLKPE